MHANDHPYLLGLTGGIATGKTEAGKSLQALGATLIDADKISHALTAPVGAALPAIREHFGDAVFLEDGTLNRRALGERVFGDEQQRRALEAILHPAVQREMLLQIELAKGARAPLCVLVVPLLFECGIDALCDEVWVTTVDRKSQQARLMARDKIDRSQAQARIDSQMPSEERERRADIIIRTDRPIQDTQKEIKRLYEGLMKRITQ